MRLELTVSILILVNVLTGAKSAQILCVFQFPSQSHQVVYQTIWRALSQRGHQVLVVTPNPLKDASLTNLTEIDVSEIVDIITPDEHIEKTLSKDVPTPDLIKAYYDLSEKLQEKILQNEEFRKVYRKNSGYEFDLILVELLHPGMYSLAGRFKAPIIGVSSLGAVDATHYSVGNPIHPVLYPDMNLPHHVDLNLFQKLYSTYYTLWLIYYYNYHFVPNADKIARKYLGEDLDYLGNLADNVSMLFLNTNPIIYNIKPTVPNVIALGGIHIKRPKPLPKDLQNILDDAKDGVVYFSLGSNVKSVNIDGSLRNTIIAAISELPYTILWKWEADDFPNKPKNLVVRKWFPQQDLLAHPNVKVFVTQGGLQSAEEAIDRGVPMVGIPFIGDQPMNVEKLVSAGAALGLDYVTLTKIELQSAIIEIAQNESYRIKMKELRAVLYDQPMTGLERAVWWSEYVIRNKGAKYLKSQTGAISWWRYFLLDVIALSVGIIVMILYILKKIWQAIFKLVGNKEKTL